MAPAALADLRGIRRHIAQTSAYHAEAFLTELTAKVAWIAEVDFTGVPRDHILEGLRALPFRQRCIYYRSYADRIVVLRVLHGAQDVEKQQFDRGD
ncbi:plasmid stabilization system [Rhizobium rhizosphaerae]|uniref:Plasmid stabilization system n=1 Tax=Xaviernesmea rhizosphaerae TaxID=1672749 RepID=A0ABX3PI44_9HYPH|nr:type II toxin-antitoxin system RelE/ParE family toxin [Xaviernesmea rhizosphaerae]OQP88164.1 plasmid stabilization system [Xaviernesmea rhizosphaerae]